LHDNCNTEICSAARFRRRSLSLFSLDVFHPLKRKIGLTLLWLGFIWLACSTVFVNPIERSIIYAHYDRLPKDPSATFSQEDIHREISDSTFEAMHFCHLLMYPAIMMLVGGLLLGSEPMSGRRTTSNQSLQPTAGRSDN
jgi:hypothetical protein